MSNGEEMWSNGQIEAETWQFVYLGYVDTQNSAEEPKCSQNEPAQTIYNASIYSKGLYR